MLPDLSNSPKYGWLIGMILAAIACFGLMAYENARADQIIKSKMIARQWAHAGRESPDRLAEAEIDIEASRHRALGLAFSSLAQPLGFLCIAAAVSQHRRSARKPPVRSIYVAAIIMILCAGSSIAETLITSHVEAQLTLMNARIDVGTLTYEAAEPVRSALRSVRNGIGDHAQLRVIAMIAILPLMILDGAIIAIRDHRQSRSSDAQLSAL